MAVLKQIDGNGKYCDDMAVQTLVEYATNNKEFGRENRYIGGHNFSRYDADTVIEEWKLIQALYRKTSGKKLLHYVLSFEKGENVLYQEAAEIAYQISKFFADEYQVFYGVHEDTDLVHIHMIVNTVSFRTGKKITNEYGVQSAFKDYITHTPMFYQLGLHLEY